MKIVGRSSIALLAILTGCSGSMQAGHADLPPLVGVHRSATDAPVACSELQTMRGLNKHLRVIKNSATGDSLEYVVVGDGAKSDDVIVFFPGTGQTLADWPVQMITNSAYSPKIVGTLGYRSDQDGSVSLCHDYRLVFFDYPGIGLTAYRPNATHDAVASDVDAMLQRIGRRFSISTKLVDPLGWSLGTAFALKYAFLSPISRPERKIHSVVLFAAGPGGSRQAQVGADNASCVTTLFAAAETATGSLADEVKADATKLLFPYKGQGPKENGTHSNCTATISGSTVTLNVTPQCTILNGCKGFIATSILGLKTYPWSKTDGVSGNAYVLQRHQDNDFDVAYCGKAGAGFTSEDCTAYGTIEQSITDGGVCQTDTSNPDLPVASKCVTLNVTGRVAIFDGFEDIFTQWTYDRALERGLNAANPHTAYFIPYPGRANHGLMLQHPRWAQAMAYSALQQ